ncbi:MAG: calcium/sodium antiporter [Bacteroidota bacterium]|nr:calcium/sodium antiporter [Bacteroidota bacterium]
MEIFINIIIIIISIVVISKGAILLVDSSVRIAKKLGVSELIIGLTIVALGTSAPEFAVTIISSLRGMSDISVGNIVGSNIFNLGFILGGTAIVRDLSTNKIVVFRDGGFLLAGSILLTFFLWDLTLSHTEGAVLFTLLFVYLGYLYWSKEPVEHTEEVHKYNWYDPLLLVLSLVMVVGSSHFLVESASLIAKIMGISDWVIGATIVAAGTSAPELATSIAAALRGHYGISVGNLIGSDIFNMYGVLGVASIMRDLPVDIGARANLIMLVIMILIAFIFMRTGWKISRREGILLVLLGLSRWIYSFMMI